MEDPFQKSTPQSLLASTGEPRPRFRWLWFILAGIFLILILAAGFYWWFFSQDYLIASAPVDSVLYANAKQPIWPWPASTLGGQQYTIADLPVENFYNQADQIFSLELQDDILPHVSQAAFVLIPNQESNQLDWVFIFKLKRQSNIEQILSQQPNHLVIKKNIIAVATSKEALDKIKEVQAGSIFSLANQVDRKKLNSSFLNLYFNPEQLKPYLNQDDLSVKVFNDFAKDDIYLNLKRTKGHWRFKIDGGGLKSEESTQTLANYLPNNFFFYTNGIKLVDLFAGWGQLDPDLAESFNQVDNSFQVIYQFDLQDMIPLLNQSTDLIILNPEKESALGLDFIITLPSQQESDLANLEKLIQIVLAQKLPQEVNHWLPDGTKVTELKMEPEAFAWQSKELKQDSVIKYLEEPRIDFQMAYLIWADKVLIASSAGLLENFINNQDISLTNLSQTCKMKSEGNLIAFNQDFAPTSTLYFYLPSDMILLKTDDKDLIGCIL